MVAIHDRMPVVLGAARARAWLVNGGRPEVEALGLLALEVSPRVNSVDSDDASVLEPRRRADSYGCPDRCVYVVLITSTVHGDVVVS